MLIADEVADLRALVGALHLGPVHVVGVSYSAAIALTAASTSPGLARTLTVMEPPPTGVPSTPGFVAANQAASPSGAEGARNVRPAPRRLSTTPGPGAGSGA